MNNNFDKPESGVTRDVRGGRLTLFAPGGDTPAMRRWLDDPDNAWEGAEIVKDSRTTRAGVVTIEDGTRVFVKRYNNKGVKYTWRNFFLEPRAIVAFNAGLACAELGIETPKPLAVMVERGFGVLKRSFLVTEVAADIEPTLEFHKRLISNAELEDEFIESVSSLVAHAHAGGLIHGDLKMSNIIVKRGADGGYDYGLWDLDVARIGREPSVSVRTKELARLASSFIEMSCRFGVRRGLGVKVERMLDVYQGLAGIRLYKVLLLRKISRYLRRYEHVRCDLGE